ALAIGPAGELAVAGYAAPRAGARQPSEVALARFAGGGAPDLTFGAGGEVRTDLSGFHDKANALAVAPDGGLVAVGASASKSGRNSDFAVARYRADGTPDSTFGSEAFRTGQ